MDNSLTRITVDEVMHDFEEGNVAENETDVIGSYAWEQDVERSWDALYEQNGVLEYKKITEDIYKRNYLNSRNTTSIQQIRKGMIRNLMLIIDMSSSMKEMDFKPNRLECSIFHTEEFIKEFFLQNPISHLGLIILKNRSSTLLQPLSTVPEEQILILNQSKQDGPNGDCSLQNGLERAIRILSSIPPYGTKEILIIFGSLKTCDARPIEETIKKLTDFNIVVNAVSLTPELFVLKKICNITKGSFVVALHKSHFQELLFQHTLPPPHTESIQPILVKMGFPKYKKTATAALCSCHQNLTFEGYICPQCGSKLCEIPSQCKCCLLNLVSPGDISRTFYHLFPPSPFQRLPDQSINEEDYQCEGCTVSFKKGGGQCMECKAIFCFDCDIYTHEQLHQCPFCIMNDVLKLENEVI